MHTQHTIHTHNTYTTCGNYYFLCVVIHAHYLPVSKPDVMFYVLYIIVYACHFVTHLVWCSLYVLLFRACQVSITIVQEFVNLGPRAGVLTVSRQQYYKGPTYFGVK